MKKMPLYETPVAFVYGNAKKLTLQASGAPPVLLDKQPDRVQPQAAPPAKTAKK